MFTNTTDIFVTRVENPTGKDFCHRGLPRLPVVPAKGFIDVKGVYTQLFRDEWFKKAVEAGMKFKIFTVMPCEQVRDLSSLPGPAAAEAVRVQDPDALPKPTELEVTRAVELEPPKAVEPFKVAAAKSEKRSESLPSGVVRYDDLMAAESDRTIDDAELMRSARKTGDDLGEIAQPVAEAEAVPAAGQADAGKAADIGAKLAQSQKGGKSGKKRSWLGGN